MKKDMYFVGLKINMFSGSALFKKEKTSEL